MFWMYNQSSPQIDTVVSKEDLTLNELLDQENILQELKSQNAKLIDFITRSDILNQLVGMVTEEPSDELEEHEKYRRPNLACEVLTTDIPRLNESLSNTTLLTKLFSFLESDPPLNPLLASFFSRTLSLLICRNMDQNWYSYQFTCLQVLDFLKSKNNSLKLLLKHLGTSAIMDLTLKLITQVEGADMQQNLINWLESEKLISSIISLFHPSVDADRQYNAAQLICDTIKKCREKEITLKDSPKPDPIMDSLQSPETIEQLLKYMLEEDEISESSITGGISVLLALLEPPLQENPNRRGPSYTEEISVVSNPALPTIVSAIVPFLPKLHDLLINPPKKNPIKLANGTIETPLGNTRLAVIKIISALIATNSQEVCEKLNELNTVQVLLDLFFYYTWNNFLHTQVEKSLSFAFETANIETENNPLISNIFIKCRLLQRILEAWEDNKTEQGSAGGKRRGYMGHLTNIANSVVKKMDCPLGTYLNNNLDQEILSSWAEFVENTLSPINQTHSRVLGGQHPSQNPKDDSSQYNMRYTDDGSLQQNFSSDPSNYNYSSPDFDSEVLEPLGDVDVDRKRALFELLCDKKTVFESSNADGLPDEEDVWLDLPNGSLDSSFGNWSVMTSSDEDEKEMGDCQDDDDLCEDNLRGSKEAITTSSDEDEKENAVLGDDLTGGNSLIETVDPWGMGSAFEEAGGDEGWADFGNADIENQFQAVQLASAQNQDPVRPSEECEGAGDVPTPPESSDVTEKSIPTDTPTPALSKATVENEISSSPSPSKKLVEEVPAIAAEETLSKSGAEKDELKSDNNANSISKEDAVPEDELIDNFRFLSKQGMMAEKEVEKAQMVESSTVVATSTESGQQSTALREDKPQKEAPSDPV